MKHAIRSYYSFLPRAYILWAILILPMGILIESTVLACIARPEVSYSAALIALPVLNIIADRWCLGGICCKECEGLEFLKSSLNGEQIMKGVVRVDIIRRLLWSLLVVGAMLLGQTIAGQTVTLRWVLAGISGAITAAIIENAALNWLRGIAVMQSYMAAMSLIMALTTIIVPLVTICLGREDVVPMLVAMIYTPASLLLCGLVSILTAKNMIRHYRKSFADPE